MSFFLGTSRGPRGCGGDVGDGGTPTTPLWSMMSDAALDMMYCKKWMVGCASSSRYSTQLRASGEVRRTADVHFR